MKSRKGKTSKLIRVSETTLSVLDGMKGKRSYDDLIMNLLPRRKSDMVYAAWNEFESKLVALNLTKEQREEYIMEMNVLCSKLRIELARHDGTLIE